MGLKARWTRRAVNNYIQILQYIQQFFGEKPAKEYEKQIMDLVLLLQSFPELGVIQNEKENIRGIILYRRTTVFYRVKDEVLITLNVIDNRMKK